MENLNLVLKFKLAGDGNCHIRGAARIKVDGQGGLTVYDAGGEPAEKIDLTKLQSMSIQGVSGARKAA
jgi:hypothetical protein